MLPTLKSRDAPDGVLSLMDDAGGGGVQDSEVGHNVGRGMEPLSVLDRNVRKELSGVLARGRSCLECWHLVHVQR
jgi:hypothetical protein